MKKINSTPNITFCLLLLTVLTACTSAIEEQKERKFSVNKSYLNKKNERIDVINAELQINDTYDTYDTVEESSRYRFVPPLKRSKQQLDSAEDVLNKFSNSKTITMAADELPLKDYLHQVLGEQLAVSYILGDEVKNDARPVSLNLQNAVTERKLFTLTEEILSQRDYLIKVDDNIFYVHKAQNKGNQGDVVFGYGRNVKDVPKTSLNIIQMVPFIYGMNSGLAFNLKQMLNVKASNDSPRNSINIEGKRKDIIRALQLIRILDTPNFKEREIGIYKSVFLSTDELIKKLTELLAQEGISLGDGKSTSKALAVVELSKQNEVIFFANSADIISRAVFWAEQIDKPIKTIAEQYFIYSPKFSRAVDMGQSLEALIGGSSSANQNQQTTVATENSRRASIISASSQNMNMVVDERANVLIFYTSGESYQKLLPLIKRLDILPKQIMLEVMIAEVTLTDEFKQGVEFAFQNGNYGLSTAGAFMGDGFGGLSYLLQGDNGNIAINLLQTNSLVNVLSKPSLVVRDGVGAQISVGTDIPIVGQTASDPISGDKQTTSIEYRKTGVELSVKPTVNAQGVVLMVIDQKISNQLEVGSTVAGSPSVFERSIRTEVIAESGQTIVLGGLISESTSLKDTKVPILGDLPLIGKLFQAETNSGDKTELVVFVTPRVIESSVEWDDIMSSFRKKLSQISIE